MPPTLIIVNGTTRVMEGDIPAFIRSVMACAAETVKKAGCVYYYTGRDLIQADLFRLSEAGPIKHLSMPISKPRTLRALWRIWRS